MSPEVDFGNDQDISVHDKDHPTLGPTMEAQDVNALERIVVPMGSYTDPNNPLAASGTVNVGLNDHPVVHSEDYGQAVADEFGEHEVQNPLSDGLRELGDGTPVDPGTKSAKTKASGLPEDRATWKKADWQTHAKSLELASSGNIDALKKRVEDHEAAEAERGDYEKEVRAASRDDLDKMAGTFEIDPATYSTKELLAEAVIAAEYGEEVPEGDKPVTEEA